MLVRFIFYINLYIYIFKETSTPFFSVFFMTRSIKLKYYAFHVNLISFMCNNTIVYYICSLLSKTIFFKQCRIFIYYILF